MSQKQEDCFNQKQLQQTELQMLVEECEELIQKLESCQPMNDQVQPEQSYSIKRQKNRLEKEFIDLCLQIQRQQKELHNYRFKMQVAQKETEYYTRQIKQKEQILKKLQTHKETKKMNKK